MAAGVEPRHNLGSQHMNEDLAYQRIPSIHQSRRAPRSAFSPMRRGRVYRGARQTTPLDSRRAADMAGSLAWLCTEPTITFLFSAVLTPASRGHGSSLNSADINHYE